MGRKISTLITIFFFFASLGFTQDKDDFQEKIRVFEHLTDLVVKDGDGNFVKGLKKSDFSVYIDGKEIQVKSLKEYNRILPDDPRVVKYLKDLENAEKANAPAPTPPTEPRNIILLFDRYNMSLNTLRKSKENARVMLEKLLLPYDRVAVFEFNKNLRHLAGPTSDKKKILAGIDAVSNFSHNPYLVPDPLMLQTGNPNAGGRAKLIEENITYDLNRYSMALTQVANAMSFLPGKKNFLVFSDGPDGNIAFSKPDSTVSPSVDALSSTRDFSNPSVSGRNIMSSGSAAADGKGKSEMAMHLDSSNSTFYFIRRGFLQPAWMLGVDGSTGSPDKETLLQSNFFSRATDIFRSRIDNMWLLALKTGGKVYTAGVTEENLFNGLSAEVGDFYTISFAMPELKSGKFYSLEVRPKNREYEVVARSGFFGARPFPELSEKEKKLSLESSLISSAGVNQLDLETSINLVPSNNNSYLYYSYRLPVARLTPSEAGEFNLEQIICVHDKKGELRFRTHKIFVSPKEMVKDSLLTYIDYIPVLPEGSRISSVLRDNVSGRISVSHRDVKTMKRGDSPLSLAEPVFLSVASGEKLEAWKTEEIKDNEGINEPIECAAVSLSGLPMAGENLVQGKSVLINLQVTDLPESFQAEKANLFVEFSFRDEERKYILLQKDQKVQLLKNKGTMIYTADIPLGLLPVAAGDLEVLVKGLDGEAVLVTSVPFIIKDFSETKANHFRNNSRIILEVK